MKLEILRCPRTACAAGRGCGSSRSLSRSGAAVEAAPPLGVELPERSSHWAARAPCPRRSRARRSRAGAGCHLKVAQQGQKSATGIGDRLGWLASDRPLAARARGRPTPLPRRRRLSEEGVEPRSRSRGGAERLERHAAGSCSRAAGAAGRASRVAAGRRSPAHERIDAPRSRPPDGPRPPRGSSGGTGSSRGDRRRASIRDRRADSSAPRLPHQGGRPARSPGRKLHEDHRGRHSKPRPDERKTPGPGTPRGGGSASLSSAGGTARGPRAGRGA